MSDINHRALEYSTDTEALQKRMIELGIRTNTELSRRSNVSRQTIDGVVNGTIQPSTNVMYKLAAALLLEPAECGAIFFKRNLRIA